MDRKKFLRKSFRGMGTIVALPTMLSSCTDEETIDPDPVDPDPSLDECALTPAEAQGPFPNLTPAELARNNIISDRTGIAFLINLTITDQSNDCQPMEGVLVDIWHCDAEGNYSQYGNTFLQQADYTDQDFLRGRQTTDADGKVSFISIFPGWYEGRAPHIHIDVLDANENSLLITQLAFPKEVCDEVYATEHYLGEQDTLNETDMFFGDGFDGLSLDSLEGNLEDGYTMEKTIIV